MHLIGLAMFLPMVLCKSCSILAKTSHNRSIIASIMHAT
jgi:hypothetical protein